MAALPVVGIQLDYTEELEKIQSFLSEAKQSAIPLGTRDPDEEEGDDDAEDGALDIYLGDHLDLNQEQRRTGLKYKDAMVGG